MNKGRAYKIPGIGLAGDWPGGWTQTYAQIDTEAGPNGFDKHYFVQQVAGLTQPAGELMLVKPLVIDLGWGTLKTALVSLKDSDFVAPQEAATCRQMLLNQYVAAFRHVEAAALDSARSTLNSLAANVSAWVAPGEQGSIRTLVDGQRAKRKWFSNRADPLDKDFICHRLLNRRKSGLKPPAC
jgi:hypothetical protein